MKQNLQLKVSQNLALTPQLQQSIRLLQLSTLELSQELDTILQDNPLLELAEGDDLPDLPESNSADDTDADESVFDTATSAEISADSDISSTSDTGNEDIKANEEFDTPEFENEYEEYGSSNNWDEATRQNTNFDSNDSDYERRDENGPTLAQHLVEQLKHAPLTQRDKTLAALVIDSINEDGYFEGDLELLADELPEELEVDVVELEAILKLIQSLDPIGVGARDLKECLLLQLDFLPEDEPHLAEAKSIVNEYLPMLANKDFTKLKKALNCNDEVLKGAQTLIVEQDPKPGSQFANISHDHFIQHDVVVKKVKGIWVATLNDGVIPKLRINQLYASILKESKDNSGQYLQTQMQEAKWMIKNIQQRFSTILRVSQAIIDRQRNFFEHGEIAMRPLVLREIADELELHESTISRVTTNKYMLTPRGVYELKYFFGSSVATDAGGTCSATAIRALIKQLVAEENPQKPLSDNKITQTLADQGIVVARRTIAKYRESLNIPPANLRKSL